MATIATAGGTVSGSAQEIIITAATGVAVVVVLYWLAKREVVGAVASIAKPVITAVNPASDQNLAYKAISAIYTIGTDNNDLGVQLYEDAQSAKKLFNPANDQNIVNQGVNAIVNGVTGDKNASLGTKIYDGVQWLKNAF